MALPSFIEMLQAGMAYLIFDMLTSCSRQRSRWASYHGYTLGVPT